MPRPARFRQADVTRAVKAFARAGLSAAAEIRPDGTIHIYPLATPAPVPDTSDEWAAWEAKKDARRAKKHSHG